MQQLAVNDAVVSFSIVEINYVSGFTIVLSGHPFSVALNKMELSSLLTHTGKSDRLPSSTVNTDAKYLLNLLATFEGDVMTVLESSVSMELCSNLQSSRQRWIALLKF